MRRQLVVMASVGLACSSAWCGAANERLKESEELIFWAPQQPVFVRLSFVVEGRSHRSAWNAAAGQLFDAFDRNADGTITSDEDLQRLLGLVSLELVAEPSAARGAQPSPVALRRGALPALLESRGIGPFCIAPAAAPQAAPRSAMNANQPRSVEDDLLLLVLDENRSGDLSAEELLLSRRRKLDLDDDECLSARELLTARLFAADNLASLQAAVSRMTAGGLAFAPRVTRLRSAAGLRQAARELLTRYDFNRDGLLAIDELRLAPREAGVFDQDRNERLDVEETEQMLRHPRPTFTLECRWPVEDSPERRTVLLGDQTMVIELSPSPPTFDRDSMLKLFMEMDGDRNQYVEPTEVDSVPYVKRAFRVMDRDADERLVAAEVVEYAERVALIAPRQIVATFQTQSRNVFETIDANRDGKFSPSEMEAFATRIPGWDADRNGAVTPVEVASTARLILGPAVSWAIPQGNASSQRQSLRQSVWFTRMDRNQDGVVSQREFLGPRETFLRLETSGDGLLDAVEAARN